MAHDLLDQTLMASPSVVLVVLCSSLAAAGTIPSGLTVDQIANRMISADEQKRANLPEYSVTRKYVLRNVHMKRDAEMLVRVSYSKGEGKTFQVLESSGVEGMSKRVFQHLLDAEKDASRQTRGRLNNQNYHFELLGTETVDGRRCYILALHPKVKTKDVFNGKVWVDADDFAVTKLEGHPAANLSFWVGKPLISQTWQKTGEYWMAAQNRSHSDSMIFGASDLTVENTGYEIKPASQTGSRAQSATADPAVASLPSSHRSDR
ncbi:MAG: hypothetical protein ACR2NN_06190 [Bryobacteraceae bacterium]